MRHRGLTCSQIAAEIGVTRNAVIGKIHRLGLTTSGRPGRRPLGWYRGCEASRRRRGGNTAHADFPRDRRSGPTVVPFPAEIEVPVDSARRCSLIDLASGGCRWPLSDPGKADFGFCGSDAIAGFSYCAGHARLAYRLPSGRRA